MSLVSDIDCRMWYLRHDFRGNVWKVWKIHFCLSSWENGKFLLVSKYRLRSSSHCLKFILWTVWLVLVQILSLVQDWVSWMIKMLNSNRQMSWGWCQYSWSLIKTNVDWERRHRTLLNKIFKDLSKMPSICFKVWRM